MLPLAVLLYSALNYDQACTLLSSLGPFPKLTAGLLEDSLWEISEDFGERNSVEKWEKSNCLIPFGMFLASAKTLKPCYEAESRKNTKVLHLFLQGRYPLFAYSHTNEKEKKNKKGFSTSNSILWVAVFEKRCTGHSVLPQFLARRE